MSRVTLATLAAGLLLAGCGRNSGTPVSDSEIEGVAYGDYVIGEPLRYENLTIFPVASATPRTEDRFVTLDEGLKAGTVEIRERGGALPGANPLPNSPADPAPDANEAPNPAPQGAQPAQPQTAPQPPPPQPSSNRGDQQERRPAPPQPQEAQSVAELALGPSVNEVVVINRSGKPLYLMPGDLMIGGQQDRVIGAEILVEASGQPITIPVYCVERGRWSERDVAQNVGYLGSVQANEPAPLPREQLQKLAEAANDGKFVRSAGVVTKDVRLAVQGEMNQDKVWDEVAKANGKNGARSQSSAFTANFGDKQLAERLDPFIAAFQTRVSESPNVVGVIVAVNGRPHSVDVFEATPLFQKLWPKLLKSFALDALGSSPEMNAHQTLDSISGQLDLDGDEIDRLHREASATFRSKTGVDCDLATAVNFLKETCEAQVAKTDKTSGVALMRRESDSVSAFVISVIPVEGASAPSGSGGFGGGGGGFGGPVHAAGFSK